MPAPANRLVIALAQIASVVGDIEGNLARLREARAEAAAFGADIVLAPELYLVRLSARGSRAEAGLSGGVPRRLRDARARDRRRRPRGAGRPALGRETARSTTPSALLDGGRIEAVRFKVDLPNYGVFDEKRVFRPGPAPGPIVFRGVRIGVPICEDIWGPDPVECIAETGGEILLVPNASPYERDKLGDAPEHRRRARGRERPAADLSQPGRRPGRTGVRRRLVRASTPDRSLAVQLPGFRSCVARTVWERGAKGWRCAEGPRELVEQGDEGDYAACVLGLRDYVDNNRFPGVVLGLSGGVDSALCAAMAVDALGAARVHAVMLPYRFTSMESLRDAEACAKALGIRYDVVPIAEPVEGVERCARADVRGPPARHHRGEHPEPRARPDPDVDLQQVRRDGRHHRQQVGNVGRLRHALRRHERRLQSDQGPLQDGGLPPLRLAQSLEAGGRAGAGRRGHPARDHRQAALAPNCARTRRTRIRCRPTRSSTRSCMGLVEKEMRVADIVAEGFDPDTVRRVERLLYLAEYKRRQSAPGVKVGPKNFGRDRRYPIVNRFRDSGAPLQPPDASIAPRKSLGTSERFEE